MKATQWITVLGIVGAILSGRVALGAAVFDPVVNQVSASSYQHYLDDLLYTHSGDSRYSGTTHDAARDNISSELSGFGLTTTKSSFTYSGASYYNVVAERVGTIRPNDIYIIGAHFDSVSGSPGADDDASGVAGVLEAARVLSGYQFDATVRFIAFDREEQWMVGSSAYVSQHASENIVGMISLDLIAHKNANNQVSIYGATGSNPLKETFQDSVTLYGDGLTGVVKSTDKSSDHRPFQNAGYQAILVHDDNTSYHTSTDSVDTPNYIDYTYAANITRSTVGYLATEAGLHMTAVPEPNAMLAAIGLVGLVIVVHVRSSRRKHLFV